MTTIAIGRSAGSTLSGTRSHLGGEDDQGARAADRHAQAQAMDDRRGMFDRVRPPDEHAGDHPDEPGKEDDEGRRSPPFPLLPRLGTMCHITS